MHALQRRRALRHDGGAGRALADEADRLDVGMLGQRLAGILAEAVHGVEHARRQAGLEADLRQQHRGERAPFGRLVHDRAAGRERGRDLPGRQHERRVPGRDDAHGADRLADRVVEMRVGRQRQAVIRARRAVGIEAEILRAAHRRLRHVADRLAGIDRTRPARSRRRAPRSRRRSCAGACARSSPVVRDQPVRNALVAAFAARSISAAPPRATLRDHRSCRSANAVSKVCAAAGVRLAVDQVRDRLVAEALQEFLRARDRLVERACSCGARRRSRMPLRSSRVSGSISWNLDRERERARLEHDVERLVGLIVDRLHHRLLLLERAALAARGCRCGRRRSPARRRRRDRCSRRISRVRTATGSAMPLR